MPPDPNQSPRSRENTLAVALALLVVGIVLFFLWLISFGIVGNVLMGALIVAMVGIVHYLVWGRSFSEEIAAEREALRRQDAQAVSVKKPKVSPDAIQDLARTQGIKSEPEA
jgi:hypothetical protein